MNIKTVGIVGAGQMGGGIAQVCVHAGYSVLLYDLSPGIVRHTMKKININLSKQVDTVSRIKEAKDYQDFFQCDLVIEAVTEDMDIKVEILRELSGHLHEKALLASNTSSLSITSLAAHSPAPQRFMGIHFMNPVPEMGLVEVIRGLLTDDAAIAIVRAFISRLNKRAILANDFPAFIVNRILLLMVNEAIYTLHEGVGDIRSIDNALRYGAHHPMGPLQLADFIGLDTCLAVMRALHQELADSKYRPCPLLVKYVEAGWLGKKSGRGFYDYSQSPPVPTR